MKLFITDAAAREVEWRPAAAESSVTGSFDFRIRVTTAGGQSYSCPRPQDAAWKLTVKPSTATADVADVA